MTTTFSDKEMTFLRSLPWVRDLVDNLKNKEYRSIPESLPKGFTEQEWKDLLTKLENPF